MNKKKILLVDDEKDMVFALKMQLEANGFEVITAYDGQDALDMFHESQPDLIILDVMLPNINGYKICRMLKFDDKHKKTPVVMLTARVQDGDRDLGFQVGADEYMTKPFEPEDLLKRINKLLKEE